MPTPLLTDLPRRPAIGGGYQIRNKATGEYWSARLGWGTRELADTYQNPLPTFPPTPGNSERIPTTLSPL